MNTPYSSVVPMNVHNRKTAETPILNIDTIRGCKNNCVECYAKILCVVHHKDFETPVPVEKFIGKPSSQYVYRIGNVGDPATDWTHTEKMIKQYGFQKYFLVTKLQSVKGYTGLAKRLQVSVDPLNGEHFKRTLRNIERILKFKPEIVMRIRSMGVLNNTLAQERMQEAVRFANRLGISVLETRLRFRSWESLMKQGANKDHYEFRENRIRPKMDKSFLSGVKSHFICDKNGGKCKSCLNCLKLFGGLS